MANSTSSTQDITRSGCFEGQLRWFRLNAAGKWQGLWIAYLSAAICVLVFTVLSLSILGLQQRMFLLTNETQEELVPQFIEQIRAVRNLGVLIQHGSVATRAAGRQVRQKSAVLATFAAANAASLDDDDTRQLVSQASELIQEIVAGERDANEWRQMEQALSLRADLLAVSTGQRVMKRASDIRDDSLIVRNVTIALAALFAFSIGLMLLLGRFLTRRIKLKSQLFNEASHDFRQRLHGMQLLINTARRLPAKQVSGIMLSLTAVMGELQRYLDNFLEIARMDAVAVRPQIGRVSLQRVFQRLELQFEEIAKYNNIDIKFIHTRAIVFSDERILLRILENVVSNAIKFARSKVLVATRCRAGVTEVFVIDNGPGMPDDSDDKLRGEFIQGDGAPKPGATGGGFGLGLSIVTRSAKLLNASVRISSRAGHGSMIRLIFDGPRQHHSALVPRKPSVHRAGLRPGWRSQDPTEPMGTVEPSNA